MNQLAKTFTCGARGSSLGTLRVRSTGLVVSSHNARPSSGLAHGTDVTNPSTMLPRSFVDVPHASHFPLQNLPYGVFSTHSSPKKRIGVAIGSSVIDLSALSDAGLLNGPHLHKAVCFHDGSLNAFMAMGRTAWTEARTTLIRLLSAGEGFLRDNKELLETAVLPMADVTLHMPANIGDYTDFYASREHATNCGEMFRGKGNELNENWVHIPIAYHGRSSSIVVSGTPVRRPRGQISDKQTGATAPRCGPCQRLDIELEMATTISPWVVTMDALEPFRCAAPVQDPPVLPYLQEKNRHTYDINLEVSLQPQASLEPTVIAQSNLKHLYWTMPQMVSHHTLGGCNLQPGDLLGTGTISCGADKGVGSLLEASWSGTRTVDLKDGQHRTFLEDGDTVTLTGYCQGDGYRVGFGKCSGMILPALSV
ncbi:hypothetical protein ABBQ32_001407 [Trebouxia sp. C0010 RCD-2024]